jgi:SAM-dependent methyltransferase
MTGPDTNASIGDETYGREFFESQADASLRSARLVLERLFPLLRPQRVLDVGCGVGSWMRASEELGATDVLGIDGEWIDRSMLLIDPDHFIAADIATHRLAGILGERGATPFDLVICVEVAEHLPFERASSFVEDLVACADVILFSAAVPFQFGTHHVNEQWPEFWAILFRAQGFSCFDCLRPAIWATPGVDWWYAQNALVFVRDGSRASSSLPEQARIEAQGLSLIHPENLLANLLGLPRRHRQAAAAEEVQDFRTLLAAHLQGDTKLPQLAAPARAAAAGPEARDVFPWTRLETYRPEEEIAALSLSLAETGNYLKAANEIVNEERADRNRLRADLALELEERERLKADLVPLRAENERLRADRVPLQAENERLRADLVRLGELESRLHAQACARQLAETTLADNRAAELERRQALDVAAARFASERRVALSELNETRDTLVTEAEKLRHATAELARRQAELDARAAPIEAIRRSLPWRAVRRLLRVAGLLSQPVPVLVPPAAPSISVPDIMQLDLIQPEDEQRLQPPEARLMKRYENVVAEVRWWNIAAATARLRLFQPFDAMDYLRRNPDVAAAGIDPHDHFIQSGALEGRGQVNPEDLARLLGTLTLFDKAVQARPTPDPETAPNDAELAELIADFGPIGIFVSTRGNVFMNDLAEDLAADLRQVGVEVLLLDETSPIDCRPPVSLYIAPHEFFILGKGPEWIRDDVLSEAFLVGTEQLQTTWFQTGLPFILMARGMLDICAQNAELFARTNMAALHILPGLRHRPHMLTARDKRHPLFGVLPEVAQRDVNPSTPFRERPIDISFFGASSPRRDQFFARNAAFFSEYETFNYCRRPGRGPLLRASSDGALTRLAGHVACHSKISLNIHQGEFGYFEWHRMVRNGMCSGSLVVSDPCLPHPNFIAGEHYLQENSRHIPDLLEWLLRTEDGSREAERVRVNVDRLITETYDTARATVQMLRFLSFHRARSETTT